jgi:hypothetical protein
MKKLSLPQCRILRKLMDFANADGVIARSVWDRVVPSRQQEALFRRGAVTQKADDTLAICLWHRSMLSVWPDSRGIAYVGKRGWSSSGRTTNGLA